MTTPNPPVLVIRGIGTVGTLALAQYNLDVGEDFDLLPDVDRAPQMSDSSINFLTGDMTTSTQTWTVKATPLLSEILTSRVRQAAGAIAQEVTLNATSIALTPGSNFEAGDIVYKGPETFILGAATGGVGDATVFECTRGAFMSRQVRHRKAPNINDRVYLRPKMKDRECFVFQATDDFAEESIEWRGVIEGIRDSEDMAAIEISMRDTAGLIIAREVNTMPYRHRLTSLTLKRDGRAYGSDLTLLQASEFGQDSPKKFESEPVSTRARSLQYKDTLFMGLQRLTGEGQVVIPLNSNSRHPLRPPIPVEGGANHVFTGDDEQFDGIVNTVLCYGYAMVRGDGTYWGDLPEDESIPEYQLHHPLHALLTGLLSGTMWENHDVYDHWGRRWGIGMPADMVDIEGIEDLISATRGVEVRAMVWGWDGSSWSAADFIKAHTVLYGFYPTLNARGQFTVMRRQFRDYDIALSRSRVQVLSEAQDLQVHSSTGTVSAVRGLPWENQSSIAAVDRSEGDGLWKPRHGRSDLQLLGGEGAPPPNSNDEGGLADYLDRHLRWARFDIPQYTVSVHREEPIPVGSLLRIFEDQGRGVFWRSDGTRGTVTGQVKSRSRDHTTGAQNLVLEGTPELLVGNLEIIAPGSKGALIVMGMGILISRFVSGVDLLPMLTQMIGVTDGIMFKSYNDRSTLTASDIFENGSSAIQINTSSTDALLSEYEGDPGMLTFMINPAIPFIGILDGVEGIRLDDGVYV